MRWCFALAVVVAFAAGCTATLPATTSANPTVSFVRPVPTTPAPSGKGTWIADVGIYGTDFHYGPTGYLCGVGYNLSYGGGAPLTAVDVAVHFPDGFAAHVIPSTADRAIGWQRSATLPSPAQIHDAAWLSQIGDAVGAVCQNGAADLDSLRGTVLKVSWETVEGSYEQEFEIEDVRTQMTACGTPDGRVHIAWTDDPRRGC